MDKLSLILEPLRKIDANFSREIMTSIAVLGHRIDFITTETMFTLYRIPGPG